MWESVECENQSISFPKVAYKIGIDGCREKEVAIEMIPIWR
jgi:hypothetical protein